MAYTVTSNADELRDELRRIVEGFGFDLALENETLGEDCAHIVAEGIADRSGNSKGADGEEWKPNEEKYAKWKRKRYNVDKPNIRTGQMLSLESLLGQYVITTDSVEMLYGTATAPTRSAASSYISTADQEITDIEKAYFCSVAHARPFYELDEHISELVFQHVEATLGEYLERV